MATGSLFTLLDFTVKTMNTSFDATGKLTCHRIESSLAANEYETAQDLPPMPACRLLIGTLRVCTTDRSMNITPMPNF